MYQSVSVFFHSLFFVMYIMLHMTLHTIQDFFTREEMCDVEAVLFITVSTFWHLDNPSFKFTCAYNQPLRCFKKIRYKTMTSEHKQSTQHRLPAFIEHLYKDI